MCGHAGREPAIVREWRRSRARGGKGAGLVHSTEFSWVTLDPASHQGSVVIGITIWTPSYSCTLPPHIAKDAESPTLFSIRLKSLVVLHTDISLCQLSTH